MIKPNVRVSRIMDIQNNIEINEVSDFLRHMTFITISTGVYNNVWAPHRDIVNAVYKKFNDK